jgi:hypothetical protein
MMPAAEHPHPAGRDLERLLAECAVRRTRRSGPGGQNRNKVQTAVVLVHQPTGIGAEASERRSQAENLRVALFRLRLNLAREVRCPLVAGASPSPLWQTRCRQGRIVVSPEHDDFPAILAEALDVLGAHGFEPRPAATALGCTASQLTRLLKDEPAALCLVNEQRRARGLHALR